MCDRIREVLRIVQLDGHSCIGAQQVQFQRSGAVESDGYAALS
jgi:hypothetical protein